jgi:pilus assembly protein CpaF
MHQDAVPRFVARPPGSGPVGSAPAARPRSADFGVLARFVADPGVTDVFVNGPGEVWVDRGAGPERHAVDGLDDASLRDLAVRLVSLGGRHVDEASPCVDVRLHDGVRVHAVLEPISTTGTVLSIRLPSVTPISFAELDQAGFFELVPADTVLELVRRRENLLISGAGGAGKTTLLSALLAEADARERIVVIEDVAELRIRHPHVVSMETRQANLEGAGGVGLARLVREALRMRPDRLVLGECRGEEIRELLAALNTGHDGGAGTLHANSLDDVPARLEALGALAGLSPEAIARQAVSAIGAVLHLERVAGVRRVAALGALALDERDRLTVAR